MQKIDEWYALYAPHMKQILWDYQIKGSHAHKYFSSLVPLNEMLKRGQAELWNPYTRTYEILTWQPYEIPNWRHEPLRYEVGDRYVIWLVQPVFQSKDPVWKWRVSVWDKRDPSGLHYEVELTESQIDRVLEKPSEAGVYLERRSSSGGATMGISPHCEMVIKEPMTRELAYDFRGIRGRVMCYAWQIMQEKRVPFRDAIRQAWAKVKEEAAAIGTYI